MNKYRMHRLLVSARESVFEALKLETIDGPLYANEGPLVPVSPSIIGYWLDILDKDRVVLFRRFVHHLPHNLSHTWQYWSPQQRSKALFQIEFPALPKARFAVLFEQKLTPTARKSPEKHCHLYFSLHNMMEEEGSTVVFA